MRPMTEAARRRLVVEPAAGVAPEVAPWLWALEDCRRRTLAVLEGLSDGDVDRAGADGTTIGTLLHHVAAIEASWLYEEIVPAPFPPALEAVLTHDVRDAEGRLQGVTGESLAAHLARLAAVRAALVETLAAMDAADFGRARVLPQYDVTPGWVVHHLLQHEAEHRGAIAALAGRRVD
jgi:uncharacterized damage-inducible protein DinB